MDFAPSARSDELKAKLVEFDNEIVRPAEPIYRDQRAESGDPHFPPPVMEELKVEARKRDLWNLFLPEAEHGPGPHEPRVRAVVRGDGHVAAARRGHELLRARHRQHGDPGPVRHAAAAGAVAAAAARRRDPFVLRDDRAVGRVERRHQHLEPHRPRRRRLRDQRAQVVHERRARPALQARGVHGRHRPRHRHVPPPVDDPRPDGRARRHRRARPARVRALRRRRPRRDAVGERAGAEGEPPRRGRQRLRDRAGPPRPRPHPPLHARDRDGRARARPHVHARADARRVQEAARRSGRRAGDASPSRACRSSRCGCSR